MESKTPDYKCPMETTECVSRRNSEFTAMFIFEKSENLLTKIVAGSTNDEQNDKIITYSLAHKFIHGKFVLIQQNWFS